MLVNGGFEERPWLTLPNGNQQPKGWALAWGAVGTPLLAPKAGNGDTESRVLAVPECVSKLSIQLPPDEQLGGKDALILDGTTTYKLFGKSAFRATLAQQWNVTPGAVCSLTVPVQVHGGLKPDGVPYNIDTGAAYWRVTINGQPGPWFTYNNDFDDRCWMWYSPGFKALYGVVDLLIEFESHTLAPIDFFIDNVQFASNAPQPQPTNTIPPGGYYREYWVVPADIAQARRVEIYTDAAIKQKTVGPSYDDSRAWATELIDAGNDVKAVVFDRDLDVEAPLLEEYYTDNEPRIIVEFRGGSVPVPEPPPVTPPGFTPINYAPLGCKTSFHGIGDDGITEVQQKLMLCGASMPTAKGCQDVGWLKNIKWTDADTLTVGRFIDSPGTGSLEGFDSNGDPIAQAHARMNALLPLWEPHRSCVDYWEILNEQDPEGADGHKKLAEFCIAAMEIAEDHGYSLALFSYSMGVPEQAEWDAIATTGIFEWADEVHAISLHEYGELPRDAGSLLTRYRYVYEKHILPRGLNIPLFITECGLDGWNPSAYTDDQMIQQMAAYDAELAKDKYVAGAQLFTVGGSGSWPQFRERWVRLYPRFVDYAVSVRNRANG